MSELINFFKSNKLALGSLLVSGLGISYLIKKINDPKVTQEEIIEEIKQTQTSYCGGHGELPPDMEVSNIQLIKVLKGYSKLIDENKVIESMMVPKKIDTDEQLKDLCTNLKYCPDENDLKSINKSIVDPIWEILSGGGKRWRPALCYLVLQAYGIDIQKYLDFGVVCEIIHNGSLIIDDIQDNSVVRRNKQSVHVVHGTDISINAGNLMYFAPMNNLLKKLQKEKGLLTNEQILQMLQIYCEEMTHVHVGQAWDLSWHNGRQLETIPTENQYLQMTALKTGVLARLATRFACLIIGLPEHIVEKLSNFTESIGVAFQIQDDVLNLTGENYKNTKGMRGEDIKEGKMSLMVLQCLSKLEKKEKDRFETILKMSTDDQETIDEAIGYIKKTGSIEYAQNKAKEIIDNSWDQIKDYIPNNEFKAQLKALAYFFINRDI